MKLLCEMKRWFIAAGAAVVLFGGVFFAFALDWRFFVRTGQFTPISIVEKLESPVVIANVSEFGLETADGKTIKVPGFAQMTLPAPVARDILAHGVELSPDGTVFMLVKVHHWCGNDPVQRHLARLDLSSLLLSLEKRVGAYTEFGVDPGVCSSSRTPHQDLAEILGDTRDFRAVSSH